MDATQIVARFPAKAAVIRRLWKESESFRSLCEEYQLAVATLRRWEDEGQQQRIREYRTLVHELEGDIADALVLADSDRR
jgi:hypothetical protein